MSTQIVIPKIGFAMTEAALSEWLAADGAAITEGAALFSIESEKSSMEIEAPGSGFLKILKPAGETYPVGTIIGEIT